MADAALYKHLQPTGGAFALLYTVPAATYAVVNMLVCNSLGTDETFWIDISETGAAAASDQDIFSSNGIPNHLTMVLTTGLTLPAGTTVRVKSSTTGVNFVVSGIEVS